MKIRSITHILLFASTVLLSKSESENKIPQSVTFFVHGRDGSPEKLRTFVKETIVQGPAQAFDLQNGKECPLGQGQDIETINKHTQSIQDCKLLGHSRGGAAITNYLGKYNPTNVSMIILDAAPADILNVVDETQYKYGLFPLVTRAQKEWYLRTLYPNYPKNSTPPVESIADIKNKDLPVFIVHSHNDKVVNIRSAWQYYKAFKQANFSNVYLCELQKGSHNHNADNYTLDSDSHIYKTALHSVYKKHGFQHDPKQATLQEHEFKKLQPSIEDIDEKLRINQWKLRQQSMINIGVATTTLALCIAFMKRK